MVATSGTIADVHGNTVPLPRSMSPEAQFVEGMRALVTSQRAAAQDLKDTAQQLRIMNERQTRFSAPGTAAMTPDAMTNAIEKALLETAGGVLQQVQMMSAAAPATAIAAGPGGGPAATPPVPATGGDVSDVQAGRVSRTRHMADGTQEGHAEPLSNYERYERGRHMDLGQMRQALGRSVGRHVSEAHWGTPLTTDAWGSKIRPENALPEGVSGPAIPATAREAARDKATGVAKGVVSAMGEENPAQALMGLLPEGAGAVLGVAGAGLAAAHIVQQQMVSQRAQNAHWQAVMGGSNAEGFGQRARERLFSARNMFTMGEGEANRLYETTAGLGVRGATRENMVDEASGWYRKFGMSVEQSSELLKVASETGQTSLEGFTESLGKVTKAAREAGLNAEEMRSKWIANLKQVADTFGGENAPALATAMTNAPMAYGRELAQHIDMSGQNSTEQLFMQARSAGVRPNQLLAMGRENPGAVGDIRDRILRNAGSRLLGSAGADVFAQAAQAARGGRLTESDIDRMANQYLERADSRTIALLPQQVSALTGVTVTDPVAALKMLIKAQSGDPKLQQGNIARDAQAKEQNLSQTVQLSNAERGLDAQGRPDINAHGASRLQGLEQQVMSRTGHHVNQSIKNAYLGGVEKTGRAGGFSGDIALNNRLGAETRVRVKTTHGERDVTLTDALRYYRDQVDRGDIEVVAGDKAGKTVAEALGGKVNEGVKVTSAENARIGAHGNKASDKELNRGSVLITASPELARWLRLSTTGVATTDPASGLVPPPSQTSPDGLSSG